MGDEDVDVDVKVSVWWESLVNAFGGFGVWFRAAKPQLIFLVVLVR